MGSRDVQFPLRNRCNVVLDDGQLPKIDPCDWNELWCPAAPGTAAKHVTFTSLADKPSAGDWTGLFVDYGAKAQISYADFLYGGADGNGGDLLFYSPTATASLKVDNSSFTYSLGYGIEVDCTSTSPLPTLTLTNNTYAHYVIDTANANTEAANVGPGLTCPP